LTSQFCRIGGEGGRCVDRLLCSFGLKFLRNSQEGEGIDPFLMTSQKDDEMSGNTDAISLIIIKMYMLSIANYRMTNLYTIYIVL